MNGFNRNCVWFALDKPRRSHSAWDLFTAAASAALFVALLIWIGE